MPQQSAEPGTRKQESKLHEVDGVQVYARMDEQGLPANLDAIDRDEAKIRDIADRLQRRGYGVMRQRSPRAGKVFYLLKATWAGTGEPPDDPFDGIADWRSRHAKPLWETAMKSKLIHEDHGEKTFALIFGTGDEAMAGLVEFAKANQLGAGHFTAIGAFRDVILGYFDWEKKEYQKIPVREQVEVLSLIGDVALKDGEPKVHAHVVVGRSDGSTRGGHLIEAHVRPTLEVILTESPEHLRKQIDEESGLALIRI